MSNKIKDLFSIRLVTIISILYCISILIYFKWIYKPFKIITSEVDIPELAKVNQVLKSINRQDVVFFFIISFLLCFLVSMFLSLIYEEIVLYTKPTIAVNARLKSKKSVMQSSGNYTGFSSIGYNFNLTFKEENGVEISFAVTPKHYAIIFEGNKGILNYKQGIVNRFISFDVTAIE